MKKHVEYLKIFFILSVIPAMGAFFLSGAKSGLYKETTSRCCFHDEPLPADFYDENLVVYDPMAYFAYQVSLFSFISGVSVGFVMAYSWIYIEEEENEEGFEGRLQTCLLAVTGLEMFASVIIFDSLSKYCTKPKAHGYILMAMAVCNVYCTIFDRGIGISFRLYQSWKDMKGIFENMKVLNEKEIENLDDEALCVICDDEIEENGRLAECTHMFHLFCIREWIGQYGPICPDCNREFKTKKREYAPPEEGEEDDDPGKLDPKMIEKILSEMEKFDAKSTFFTETSDTAQKKEGGDEEEEEDDD